MQFLFGAVVFGVVFLVPNYFAELHGYSARDIGLAMIPYGRAVRDVVPDAAADAPHRARRSCSASRSSRPVA